MEQDLQEKTHALLLINLDIEKSEERNFKCKTAISDLKEEENKYQSELR